MSSDRVDGNAGADGEKRRAPSRQVPAGANLLLLWLVFLLVRALLFFAAPGSPGDVELYYEQVTAFEDGLLPYEDFSFGYPPFAFFYISLPTLLSPPSFEAYHELYRAQCLLVDIATFALLGSLLRRRPALLWLYLLWSSFLVGVLYDRLDIALAFLLTASATLRERGAWRASYIFWGLSISFKVIPVFAVPVLLAWELAESKKRALGGVAFLVAGVVLPFVPGFLISGSSSLLFFEDHARRGVQLESTWASLEMVLMWFGAEGEVYWAAGSQNLHTAFEPSFVILSHVGALAVSLGAVPIQLLLVRDSRDPWLAVACVLAGILSVSKVFSPQFLIFLLPLLALAVRRLPLRWDMIVLPVWVVALTAWLYPEHEPELIALEPRAAIALFCRNAAFLAMTVLLWVRWVRGKTR